VDEQRKRIVEDLTSVLQGDVRCDALTVAMYASDASLYEITPLGVVYPRSQEDVTAVARYASEFNIPLVARGAGTGVAGQAIGNGLIIDFSRFMRRIVSIGSDTIRVQPGIVRDRLNTVLKEHGRYFPPDPANTSVTTIGSMLAIDAAGSHAVRIGSTRDHVQSLEVTLADGSHMEAGNEPLSILDFPPSVESTGTSLFETHVEDPEISGAVKKRNLISKLNQILQQNQVLISQFQSPRVRNTCGYHLQSVLTEGHLNLARLLIGSEGTLGLFTAATLHTSPIPAHRAVVLLLFGDMENAVRAVHAISEVQPSACDLFDRRLLSLAREADKRFLAMISPTAESALLVEQTGYSEREARDRIQVVLNAARKVAPHMLVAREAYTEAEVDFLWSLPGTVVPMLTQLKGKTRPLPFVEDIAVPPESLHEFLIQIRKVFQKHQLIASLYAHAASGQLHIRPFLSLPDMEHGAQLESLARDLYQIVFAMQGSISGEHGDGLARTSFIRSQYGPLYRVFQQIKDLFDPHNLCNPGKIISDDPHLIMQHLRPSHNTVPDTVELQLNWQRENMSEASLECNGCGVCKVQSPPMRMCPLFRVDAVEENSPRSKANILRHYSQGRLDASAFGTAEMKRLAASCFNCKQCQLECPSHVDIPHLFIEAKSQYQSAHGISRSEWFLSRVHQFAGIGSNMSIPLNAMLNSPSARWLLESTLGIAQLRKLPRFARRSFMRSLPRRLRNPPADHVKENTVVYFVDYFANYHDTELARALIAILQHNGIQVFVPPDQKVSGMSLIAAGDLDAARELAEKNVRVLAGWARDGYKIVCTEPTAALCLKQEYPYLLDHPDLPALSEQVIDAGSYLDQLRRQGRLRTDFKPVEIQAVYHTPCHVKALEAGTPLADLTASIPDLQLKRIEKGCSGMAGVYGISVENFRSSLRIGWDLMSTMHEGSHAIGVTECSSCKIQMEQRTNKPTLHPLKLLALAYGIMPELQMRLQPTRRKRLTS